MQTGALQLLINGKVDMDEALLSFEALKTFYFFQTSIAIYKFKVNAHNFVVTRVCF